MHLIQKTVLVSLQVDCHWKSDREEIKKNVLARRYGLCRSTGHIFCSWFYVLRISIYTNLHIMLAFKFHLFSQDFFPFLLFFMDILMANQFQCFLSLKGPQHKADHVHVRYV